MGFWRKSVRIKKKPAHLHTVMLRRPPPGLLPGTFIENPDARPTTVRVMEYDAKEVKDYPESNLDTLRQMVEKPSVTWITVSGFGDKAYLRELAEKFNLHPLALADIVNLNQRPKVEIFDEYALVIMRRLERVSESLRTDQVSLVIGKNYVLAFHETEDDPWEGVRQRISEDRGRIRKLENDYLAYALIDTVVDGYFPVLDQYGEYIENLERLVLDDTRRDPEKEIHGVGHELFEMRRAIAPMRDMVNRLLRDGDEFVYEQTHPYLRDCYDHVIQSTDGIDAQRELVSGLRELQMSNQNQRMNEIMRTLTVVSTIFIPMSFIAGLYGMNFDPEVSKYNMPELGWTYGYPYALGLMGAAALGMLYFFKRRGWLGGSK